MLHELGGGEEPPNVQMDITLVSCTGDTEFKSRSGDSSFPEFLRVKTGILLQTRPRPVHITLIPVHSLIMLCHSIAKNCALRAVLITPKKK